MDPHVVADDVAGGAALDLSEREHCTVERGDRAADEGLEGADQGSGHDDRIDTAFRVSAVAGSAVQIDQYFVAGSVELAILHFKFSGMELRHDMETGDIVYVGILHAALLDHPLCASDRFLRRLEEKFYSTGPFTAVQLQQSGSAECDRRMGIMAAGMHHPGIKGTAGMGRILLNGKRIDVGPKPDGAADRITSFAGEGSQNTGISDHPVRNSPGVQAACNNAVGFKFLGTFFRMLMKRVADCHKLREQCLDITAQVSGRESFRKMSFRGSHVITSFLYKPYK